MKKFLLIAVSFYFSFSYANAQSNRDQQKDKGSIVKFYPNPAISTINFDFQKPADKIFSLQVYNFLGRKMVEHANINERITINLADFNRGVYIYQLLDKTGKIVESGKFQVSK